MWMYGLNKNVNDQKVGKITKKEMTEIFKSMMEIKTGIGALICGAKLVYKYPK